MAIGYHVSNTFITKVDFYHTCGGFWVADSLDKLLNCGNFSGAGLYPKKDIYAHEVHYNGENFAGWNEYDKLMTDDILSRGFTCIKLSGDTIIINPEAIQSIKVIKTIKR